MVTGPDGAAHRKIVQLGIQDGEDVQVISGVGMNDSIITEGAYGLDEGTKVKIGPTQEEGDKPSADKSEESR
jgi:multidrug efflux pump subunit AcrA (membrane-fusion protein)